MKSTIIFLLTLALLAAAFFTKPSADDFKRYIVQKQTQGDSNVLKAGWDQFQADEFVKECTISNRVLWTDVKKDGKTVYTGAFAHWFNRSEISSDLKKIENKAEKVKQAAQG